MTMQIKRGETIANVSVIDIRNFFQHVRSWHQTDFSLAWLEEKLGLAPQAAQSLVEELEKQGYVQSRKEGGKTQFELTEKGLSLSRSSAAGKVHRSTATSALEGVLQRVTKLNARSDALDDVAAIVVFGSYLNDVNKLGDLDIAVKLRDRYPRDEQWSQRVLDYAQKSGRSFPTFIDRLRWHEAEIYKVLKAGKRTISIQTWDAFQRMARDGDFRYEVIFGDPEEVRADIAKQK